MHQFQPVLVTAGRTHLGVLLGVALSMVGVAVAWGLYVFSGAGSRTTLLALFTVGAGVGAGLGGFLAWLSIEGDSPLALLGAALLAGIGGAWGGYELGGRQEVSCCAGPDITPLTYTAFGATVAANGVVLMVSLTRQLVTGRWLERIDSWRVFGKFLPLRRGGLGGVSRPPLNLPFPKGEKGF